MIWLPLLAKLGWITFQPSSQLKAVCAQFFVQETLGPRHIRLFQVFDDDRYIGMLVRKTLQIEVVVQSPQPGRRQLDGADSPEGVTFRSVNLGVLFRRVPGGSLHVFGMGNPDFVRQRVEDLI